MSATSSSTSSLLQLNRPAHLSPQPTSPPTFSSSDDCPHVVRTKSRKPAARTQPSCSDPSASSLPSDSQIISPMPQLPSSNAVASASQGQAYLNMPATTCCSSREYVEADYTSLPSSVGRQVTDSCASILSAVNSGAIGDAVPRDQWQADGSSALCTFPLCTTNFGPVGHHSYFSLAPRRHHCRMCGNLFCGSHTTQRAPLLVVDSQGKRSVARERVCDLCIPNPQSEDHAISVRSRRNSIWSQHTVSTNPSDTLVTPDQEDLPVLTASLVLSQAQTLSRCSTRVNLEVAVEEPSSLAPIESWMGPSGVLSLYPLAVNPSHANHRSQAPAAAGPLFGPSLSARRSAKEKELERLTLRERRMGSDNNSMWIPGAWGYRREDFDPTFHDEDVEGEVHTEGGLVVDGPIRFRAQARKITSPAPSRAGIRTPSEERKADFFSTF